MKISYTFEFLAFLAVVPFSFQSVMESVIYFDGDTSCSGNVFRLDRSTSQQCVAPVSCSPFSPGPGQPASSSTAMNCPASMDAAFPASMNGKKYATVQGFTSTSCKPSELSSVTAYFPDKCVKVGNEYTYATCGSDGSVLVYGSCSEGCNSNCRVILQGKSDGTCQSGYKYQCGVISSGNSVNNKPVGSGALSMPVGSLATAGAALFLSFIQ